MADRVAFSIFGIDIYWYGVLIALGVAAAIALAIYYAKKKGYAADQVYDLSFFVIPLGIVFARLYYVVFEWERYAGNLLSVFAVRDGGLAIYGAVIGGALGMYLNSRRKKGMKFADSLDCVAPGLILAQAIGRWGNFFNQEAYGSMVAPQGWGFPFAVYIEALGEWRLATFFYEFVWNLIVFGLLVAYAKKPRKSGSVFLLYLCAYGFGRMFIEGLRDDSLWLIPGAVRVSQLLSFILVVVAGTALLMLRKKEKQAALNSDGGAAPALDGEPAMQQDTTDVPDAQAPGAPDASDATQEAELKDK